MKGLRWITVITILLTVASCNNHRAGDNDISTSDEAKWQDPNFEVLPIGAFNYTDDDIYGLYVMPLDKNDIQFAAEGGVGRAQPRTATRWEMGGSASTMAWDRRWKPPHKFKVWWKRVYDKGLYARSAPYAKGGDMFDPYDPYTTKQTRPGSAWCEGVVEIKEQFGEPYGPPFPNLTRRELVFYFYPDGTVKGSLEFGGFRDFEGFDIKKRNQLPILKERSCLTEVVNPLYGKRKPRSIN